MEWKKVDFTRLNSEVLVIPRGKHLYPGRAFCEVFGCFLDYWRCSFSHILKVLWLNTSDIRDYFIKRFCSFEGTNDHAKAELSSTSGYSKYRQTV